MEQIKNHLKSSISTAEKDGENMDDVSWNFQEGILISYNDAKKILTEFENQKWISVNDLLPKKDGNSSIDCLCYDNYHGQIRVLSFSEHHNCWDDESGDDYYTDAVGGKVSHWMRLPSRPEFKTVV